MEPDEQSQFMPMSAAPKEQPKEKENPGIAPEPGERSKPSLGGSCSKRKTETDQRGSEP